LIHFVQYNMKSKRKVIVPKVVRGGTAIPLGDNLYYMSGRKHEQGGIDIGKNPRTGMEVEGGEIIQTSPSQMKVFSSVPFLGGKSPAELILKGNNPNDVFNAQERYKDTHGYNDDGTMKRNGGKIRRKAVFGSEDDYISNLQKELELSQAERIAERERRANILRNTPIITINTNSNNDKDVNYLMPEFENIIPIGENPYLSTDSQINPYGIKIATMNQPNTTIANVTNRNNKSQLDFVPLMTAREVMPEIESVGQIVSSTSVPTSISVAPATAPAAAPTIRRVRTNASSPSTGGSRNTTTAPAATTSPAAIATSVAIPATATGDSSEQINRNLGLPVITNPIEMPGNVINWQHDVNTGLSKNTPSRVPEYTSKRADYTNLILNSIGSLANIGGNLASYFVNRNMLNDLEYSSAPTPITPAKLKTRININPQLRRLYRNLVNLENSVNNNTSSSRTAIARNQRFRNNVTQAINELYAQKENAETQLINRDRLNAQQVAAANATRYDRWKQGKTEFENNVRNLRAENSVGLTQGIAGAISDLATTINANNSEARTLAYLQQSNPYAIEALSDISMGQLLKNNGYFRVYKKGGKFKMKRR